MERTEEHSLGVTGYRVECLTATNKLLRKKALIGLREVVKQWRDQRVSIVSDAEREGDREALMMGVDLKPSQEMMSNLSAFVDRVLLQKVIETSLSDPSEAVREQATLLVHTTISFVLSVLKSTEDLESTKEVTTDTPVESGEKKSEFTDTRTGLLSMMQRAMEAYLQVMIERLGINTKSKSDKYPHLEPSEELREEMFKVLAVFLDHAKCFEVYSWIGADKGARDLQRSCAEHHQSNEAKKSQEEALGRFLSICACGLQDTAPAVKVVLCKCVERLAAVMRPPVTAISEVRELSGLMIQVKSSQVDNRIAGQDRIFLSLCKLSRHQRNALRSKALAALTQFVVTTTVCCEKLVLDRGYSGFEVPESTASEMRRALTSLLWEGIFDRSTSVRMLAYAEVISSLGALNEMRAAEATSTLRGGTVSEVFPEVTQFHQELVLLAAMVAKEESGQDPDSFQSLQSKVETCCQQLAPMLDIGKDETTQQFCPSHRFLETRRILRSHFLFPHCMGMILSRLKTWRGTVSFGELVSAETFFALVGDKVADRAQDILDRLYEVMKVTDEKDTPRVQGLFRILGILGPLMDCQQMLDAVSRILANNSGSCGPSEDEQATNWLHESEDPSVAVPVLKLLCGVLRSMPAEQVFSTLAYERILKLAFFKSSTAVVSHLIYEIILQLGSKLGSFVKQETEVPRDMEKVQGTIDRFFVLSLAILLSVHAHMRLSKRMNMEQFEEMTTEEEDLYHGALHGLAMTYAVFHCCESRHQQDSKPELIRFYFGQVVAKLRSLHGSCCRGHEFAYLELTHAVVLSGAILTAEQYRECFHRLQSLTVTFANTPTQLEAFSVLGRFIQHWDQFRASGTANLALLLDLLLPGLTWKVGRVAASRRNLCLYAVLNLFRNTALLVHENSAGCSDDPGKQMVDVELIFQQLHQRLSCVGTKLHCAVDDLRAETRLLGCVALKFLCLIYVRAGEKLQTEVTQYLIAAGAGEHQASKETGKSSMIREVLKRMDDSEDLIRVAACEVVFVFLGLLGGMAVAEVKSLVIYLYETVVGNEQDHTKQQGLSMAVENALEGVKSVILPECFREVLLQVLDKLLLHVDDCDPTVASLCCEMIFFSTIFAHVRPVLLEKGEKAFQKCRSKQVQEAGQRTLQSLLTDRTAAYEQVTGSITE